MIRVAGLLSAVLLTASAMAEPELPQGWMVWHHYSEYSALDSRLYLRQPDGEITEITGDFIHPMNGSFGVTPDSLVFMAIDRAADEWDIYRYSSDSGMCVNLTERSGFRNEDPKFSPDGKTIVFKRGFWNPAADDFQYDLALMDVETREVRMLTDDMTEEAMPCFSADGETIYYAAYENGIGAISALRLSTGEQTIVHREENVTAYYPAVSGDSLYFTKWYDAENRRDQIVRIEKDGGLTVLPFQSPQYDCSDACPLAEGGMLYSSTAKGADYELFYYDGETAVPLDLLNTERNELGADFYSAAEYEAYRKKQSLGDVNGDTVRSMADVVLLVKWLVQMPDAAIPNASAADLNADGMVNVLDLTALKRLFFAADSN